MNPFKTRRSLIVILFCFALLNCIRVQHPVSQGDHEKWIDSCNALINRLQKDNTHIISEDELKDSCVAFFASKHDEEGEIQVVSFMASRARANGNYSKALQFYFECQELCKEKKDTPWLIGCKLDMADVYRVLPDKSKCFQQVYDLLALTKNRKQDAAANVHQYANIAYCYEKFGYYDSALLFLDKLQVLLPGIDSVSVPYYRSASQLIRGNARLSKYEEGLANDPLYYSASLLDSAQSYYDSAMEIPETQMDGIIRGEILLGNSSIAMKKGLNKPGLKYALLALSVTEGKGDQELSLRIYDQLVHFYSTRGPSANSDSTAYYQKQIIDLKDNIIRNHARIVAVNQDIFTTNYFKREDEQKKRRLNKMMYMLVPPFIIFFIYAIILLGKMKIRERWIESMGLVATIMIFEFIALLLHGYLDKITNENPILLLLALIAVGIALEPLHNYFQDWLKRKLVPEKVSGTDNFQ